MPTPMRKWYPGANYHITTRGNNKNKIFKHKSDFLYYISLLEETLKYYYYYKYRIICYCLMSNHIHILMKTQEKPPAEFMGRINSKYALYHNRKYIILDICSKIDIMLNLLKMMHR